jgi:pyruvate/2-oxoglutarate/acetoin dehydrogenase E1 component
MPDQEITFREAITQAMREEMQRDETVFLMGEDVGDSGGIFIGRCPLGRECLRNKRIRGR